MSAEIRLIATDLDGTLIGSVNELPLYADFSDQVERLRTSNGAVWVACTGRNFSSFRKFFSPMRHMGLYPDYVIVRHSYIYTRTRMAFLPHMVWNISILLRLWRESLVASNAIDQWHATLTAGAAGVNTILRSSKRLGLRFESDESATAAADLLRQKVHNFKHLRVFSHGTDVEVRTVPATKGLALAELAHYLHIDRENMLTIGNGANDISMLDGDVAGMVGCPSNSDPEVLEVVSKVGGHVASQPSLRGVMEILEAFTGGIVRSEIPEHLQWRKSRPALARTRQGSGKRRRHPAWSLMFFLGIGYAVLLAFARFDVIPFSSWIRLPLDLVLGLFVKLSTLP